MSLSLTTSLTAPTSGIELKTWPATATVLFCVAASWVAIASVLYLPAGWLSGFVLSALLVVCTYTDLRWHRIPNWATYTALLWALGLNAAGALAGPAGSSWLGAIGPANSFWGATACFFALLPLYAICRGGAGDVKLATAIGALVGIERGLQSVVWCFLIAGLVVVGMLVWREGLLATGKMLLRRMLCLLLGSGRLAPEEAEQQMLRERVPMAAFFAVGVILALIEVQL